MSKFLLSFCMALSVIITSEACTTCPSGFTYDCTRCLKMVKSAVNHAAARLGCENADAALVKLTSATDMSCVWDFGGGDAVVGQKWWTGAHTKGHPNRFEWTDGTVLANDSVLWSHSTTFDVTYAPKYRNNDNDCAMLKYQMIDKICTSTAVTGYLCEASTTCA